MAVCTYYRVHFQTVPPRAQLPAAPAPWCAHPQSRVALFAAAGTVGGARLLQCGGNTVKCRLPQPKQRG